MGMAKRIRRAMMGVLSLTLLGSATAAMTQTPPPGPTPIVVIRTDRGDIQLGLNIHQAPATVCNFLRYVEAGHYVGGSFFRTVVADTNDNPNPIDVIQAATPAGSDDAGFGPIGLERTRDTGLSHRAGTISMARNGPDSATSSFFIVVSDAPALDFGGARNPDGQGFAAFGYVTGGMDVVRVIQASPATNEAIDTPVKILSVELDTRLPTECRP
jgi:peptidyl-prolyl cis-trans isomerase A (cyclophilin A)